MGREPRRYWLRILLVNTGAAFAVVGISGGLAPNVRLPVFLRALGASFIYTNCIGTLLALTMPRVAARCLTDRSSLRWAILIAAMIAVTIVGVFASNVVLFWIGYIPRGRFWEWLKNSITTAVIISTLIGIAVSMYETMRSRLEDATVALRTKERDEAEARRIAAEAQLASIESRVQPHFLFNTLNSIAALVHDDPAGAERMTGQLASLLRSALDSTAVPLVPLQQELRVVRAYLDIERVRFGDRHDRQQRVRAGAVSRRGWRSRAPQG
jgi:hypothetical protein